MTTSKVDIVSASIVETSERLRRRELSPVELTMAALERFEALQPRLGCFTTLASEYALQRAREAEHGLSEEEEVVVRKALDVLSSLGASLIDVKLPRTAQGRAILHVLTASEAQVYLEDNYTPAQIAAWSEWHPRLTQGRSQSFADYLHAQHARAVICQEVTAVLHQVDVIAMPTGSTFGDDWDAETVVIRGREAPARSRAVYRNAMAHGKTWGVRGQTPVMPRPGQRQSMSAASAVNARGAFWFRTYSGELNGALFVDLLKQMMRHRKKPVHLIIDGLPAHKKALVGNYIKSTHGRMTLHFLPGYAPDLNPDELAWSHIKRTGTAQRPLQAGERLIERIDAELASELASVQRNPKLVRSSLQARSLAHIMDQ